ncbi:hypothetical protein CJ030_MR0G024303 [Morella rubra]|uniref:GRF-type domain-containing protein n=1 Tax=Morella rubra TaxID=262757 RepID=A0A6A1UGM4_9ROSI|nr:hypothetical protein CJ030_MR0G024297 [Morella rubra]KAB1199412.1 hypothetical protein CJ030_MR0G024303 [Morella rubra]
MNKIDVNAKRSPMHSASQSSSHRSGVSQRGVVFLEDVSCECGLRACLRTSLTDGNPGRQFYGCPMFSGKSFVGVAYLDHNLNLNLSE